MSPPQRSSSVRPNRQGERKVRAVRETRIAVIFSRASPRSALKTPGCVRFSGGEMIVAGVNSTIRHLSMKTM